MEQSITHEMFLIQSLKAEIGNIIIGQDYMIDRILIGLLTGGHILLEGVPGLAKTLTASTLAAATGLDFNRIQFTPDLLPADIIGTEIYHQKTGEFNIKKGAIFSHFILADEINRAPAKVQSALLEAMEEKQVTIGDQTYLLEKPFIVVATQNPLEQHGTYPLPEAQQDRFMMKLKVEYPTRDEERLILQRFTGENKALPLIKSVITAKDIMAMREQVQNVHVDDHILEYVLDIIGKSRINSDYIECGASPRGSLNLIKAAKGIAFIEGRNYLIPDDIKAVAYDVLRHRLSLSYEAEAEDYTSESMIKEILEAVKLP